jgi:hypothetical protein
MPGFDLFHISNAKKEIKVYAKATHPISGCADVANLKWKNYLFSDAELVGGEGFEQRSCFQQSRGIPHLIR